MMLTVTPAIAHFLVRYTFGYAFPFEIVGSLVTSKFPSQANDIDFIVRRLDWDCNEGLHNGHGWRASDYFPDSSYKTTISGITFNAIVLDDYDYANWSWAKRVLVIAPPYLKPENKCDRIDVWTWLLTIAPNPELSS